MSDRISVTFTPTTAPGSYHSAIHFERTDATDRDPLRGLSCKPGGGRCHGAGVNITFPIAKVIYDP
jgi:hypothetical protein